MWQKLNTQHRNYFFIAVAMLFCYLAYQLSFSHTFKAIALYQELNTEQQFASDHNGAFNQASAKNTFYNKVLATYRIKSLDPEGMLWETLSGISHAKGVNIGFNMTNKDTPDSLAVSNKIISNAFSFRGNYFALIALVDSIHKTPDIGKVFSLEIVIPKETKTDAELQLKLTIIGTRSN